MVKLSQMTCTMKLHYKLKVSLFFLVMYTLIIQNMDTAVVTVIPEETVVTVETTVTACQKKCIESI